MCVRPAGKANSPCHASPCRTSYTLRILAPSAALLTLTKECCSQVGDWIRPFPAKIASSSHIGQQCSPNSPLYSKGRETGGRAVEGLAKLCDAPRLSPAKERVSIMTGPLLHAAMIFNPRVSYKKLRFDSIRSSITGPNVTGTLLTHLVYVLGSPDI